MSVSALLMLILRGIADFIKWKALEAELKLKTWLIDIKEKYEDEATSTQSQIDDLRLAGRNDLADRMREQLIRKTVFLVDLSNRLPTLASGQANPDNGGGLHSAGGGNQGESGTVS